jgi:pimeloyl-ACP methyl ester carboxylesterase
MSKNSILKLISAHKGNKKKAVVFIHGLSGHELKTWQKKESLSLPELFSGDKDLQEFDIYSYGYPTGFFLKQYNIDDISRLLVTELNQLHGKQLIYLITHSQGGLIARQSILHLLDRGKNDEVNRIQGIVYFAVPFEGAAAGTLMKWVAAFIPNILGKWVTSVQVLSLELFSKDLGKLNERWNWNFRNGNFPNLLEKAVIGLKDKTVNPFFSARPDYITDILEVDENHRSVCKFNSSNMLYNNIKQFINNSKVNENQNTEVDLEKQLVSIADEYYRVNNYNQALEEYIKQVGTVKSKEMQVHIKTQQGLCHFHLAVESNDRKEALLKSSVKDFSEAIRLAGEDSSYSLFTILGDAYFKLASIRDAVQYLEKSKESQIKALKKCDKVTFGNDYLAIQNKIAVTYLDLAEYKNVEENVGQALSIFDGILKQDKVLESLAWAVFNNIGRCYEKLTKVSNERESVNYLIKAINFYSEALKLVTITNNPDEFILTRNNLGNAYVILSQLREGLEDVDMAFECFNDVYEISKMEPHSFKYCHVLNNLGITYFQYYKKRKSKNDLIQSISYFKKSLEHKEIRTLPIMNGTTQLNCGISLLYLSKLENTEENLNDALKSFEWSLKLFPDPNSIQNQSARSKLNDALIDQGVFKKDAELLNKAITNLKLLIDESEGINFDSNNLHSSFFQNLLKAYSSFFEVEKDKSKLIDPLDRGMEFFSKYNYKFGIAGLNKLLGVVYSSLYDKDPLYDFAKLNLTLDYFQTAATLYKELQDLDQDQYSTSASLYLLAMTNLELYVQEGEAEYLHESRNNCLEALKYIQQLLDVDDDEKNHELQRDIQELFSEIEKKLDHVPS